MLDALVAVLAQLAVLIVVASVAAPVYLRLFRHELRRPRAMARAARELGFGFARLDPAYPGMTATRYPFELFSRGTRQQCENVFSGTIDGLDLVGFDFAYAEETQEYEAGRRRERQTEALPERVTCVVARVSGSSAHIVISPVGVVGSAADNATWAAWGIRNRAIQFESRDFDSLFHVSSEDPRFANALVDPAMMQWLLTTRPPYRWELQRDYLLCTGGLIEPDELASMVSAVVGFARHIPSTATTL